MSKTRLSLILLVVAGLISACAMPTAPANTTAQLAGTHWELLSIQSMDDKQGTSRIENPEKFTLSFAADGRASFRLDCNRGVGNWSAQASANSLSGSIIFSQLASTRALCSPPHLDEKIARDMGYVRSFLFKDGKLYLSLMADGGIYEWRKMKP